MKKNFWLSSFRMAVLALALIVVRSASAEGKFNGTFEGGTPGFWEQVNAPAGWISTDSAKTYTTATGFIQVSADTTVSSDTGIVVQANQCYALKADLGCGENGGALARLVATENADGSGASEEIVHIIYEGKPGYQLTPTEFTSELVRADLAGKHLRIQLLSSNGGHAYFDNIVVTPKPASAAPRAAAKIASQPSSSSGDQFALTKNGKPCATIVIAANPTVVAAFAAKELQDHVKQITGASLPIVRDTSIPAGPVILVGESDATRKISVPETTLEFQEHLIQFKDQSLVLLGRDKEVRHSVGYPVDLANVPLPGWFDERGTLNAVYDLLEQYCGVRWYHPTDVGTVLPVTKSLEVPRKDIRRKQGMISMRGYFHATYFMPERNASLPGDEVTLWRLRMRMGGHPLQIDHSFYDYYDRFLKEHPDWFSQGYDTTDPPQLCYTNPELIQQVAQDARDYFDGKYLFAKFPMSQLPAGSDYFPLVPMDDMRWCKCKRCQAQFDAGAGPPSTSSMFSSGEASNYIWGFINNVAKELHKTHPDKFVAGIAYQQFAFYPTKVKLEPNVAVQFCLWNIRGWQIPKLRDTEMKVLNDWARREKRPMSIWAYYMNPMAASQNTWQPFPYYFGHTAIKQMKLFKDIGISAMWMAQSSELGWTHHYDMPDDYLAFRLAENPQLDGEKMLNEFFTLYYGAAAAPMQKLYDSLEKVYNDPGNYPAEWLAQPNVRVTEEIAWGRLGTPKRMSQWKALIAEAVASAKTPIEKTRVDWFVRGIWKPMEQGAAEHALVAQRHKEQFLIKAPKSAVSFGGDPAKVNWDRARDIGVLSSFVGLPNPSIPRELTVKVIHDGKWLYIQHSDEVDPSLLASGTPFGAKSFTDPIFFDSFVFLAAPLNERRFRSVNIYGVDDGWASVVGSGDATEDWKKGWRGISDKTMPKHWRAWAAVSLADLIPGGARSGTQFRGNFYRICVSPKGGWLVWKPHFNQDSLRDIKYMGNIVLE